MFQKSLYNFLLSLLLVIFTAVWCSYFNSFAMNGFYEQIQRSALTPPGYVFSIVWTLLYALMVISLDILLNMKPEKSKHAVNFFLVNLLLQILWSFAFFYNGYFLIGLIILLMLDIVAAIQIEITYKLNKTAGLLLFPFGAWILFATYLNWIIYHLNGASYSM